MSAQRSVGEVMAKYKKPPVPKIDLDVAATCRILFRQFEVESTVHSWIQESTCCFEEIFFSLYLWHALSPRKKENIESRCKQTSSDIVQNAHRQFSAWEPSYPEDAIHEHFHHMPRERTSIDKVRFVEMQHQEDHNVWECAKHVRLTYANF